MKYYGTKDNKNYGFYFEKFEGAIEITDEHWKQVLDEQVTGKSIIHYEGEVIAVDPTEYELIDNIWTKLSNDQAQYKQLKIQNAIRAYEIKDKLYELDTKRIRAVCEPELFNAEEGITWLEYYNKEIKALRDELETIEA